MKREATNESDANSHSNRGNKGATKRKREPEMATEVIGDDTIKGDGKTTNEDNRTLNSARDANTAAQPCHRHIQEIDGHCTSITRPPNRIDSRHVNMDNTQTNDRL